jgi:hypothetical protein
MAKRIAIALIVVFAAGVLFLAYRWFDRLPWLETAVRLHSERGSTNCGLLSDSSAGPHADPEVVLTCALSAHQQRRPFFVMFSVHGVDAQVSTAIVGDSKGEAIELWYPTGMFERANTLLRHRCDRPTQLIVEQPTVYGMPRLHCLPWPPPALQRDHILW